MIKFSEQVMSAIRATMIAQDITARMLSVEMLISEARVSQMLRADANLTLHTVDRIHQAFRNILSRREPRISKITRDFLDARN